MTGIDSRVQQAVAAESSVELARLAADSSPRVRRQVAVNPHTSTEVLNRFVTDRDWRTRAVVAALPSRPGLDRTDLRDDSNFEVRAALAWNRKLTAEERVKAGRSIKQDVRYMLASHPDSSLQDAEAFILDPSTEVRTILAENTPHRTVIEALANDTNPRVRKVAAGRVATGAWSSPVSTIPDQDLGLSPAALAAAPVKVRKPSTKWLKIYSEVVPSRDEVGFEVAWLWKCIASIDADPELRAWWAASNFDRLELTWGFVSGIRFGTSSRVLTVMFEFPFGPVDDDDHHNKELWRDILADTLSATGQHLKLDAVPELPNMP